MSHFKKRLLLLIFVCTTTYSFGQHYVYKHYTREHGLAGNTVYCITQDLDGFTWFGTENGVSRFDGNNFVNFTTTDGLTDNEVLEIFPDSKGRIWFACYTAPVCYYYRGKIYAPANSPQLRAGFKQFNINSIYEDRYGNIWFHGMNVFCFTKENKLVEKVPFVKDSGFIYDPGLRKLQVKPYGITAAGSFFCRNSQGQMVEFSENGNQTKLLTDSIFINDGSLMQKCTDNKLDGTNYYITPTQLMQLKVVNGKMTLLKRNFFNVHFNKTLSIDHKTGQLWASSADGIQIISKDFVFIETTLKGHHINSTFNDNNNNIWCASSGEGVYFLNASRTRYFNDANGNGDNDILAFAFSRSGRLFIGNSLNETTEYNGSTQMKIYKLPITLERDLTRKIISVNNNDLMIIAGLGAGFYSAVNASKNYYLRYPAIKDMEEIAPGKYLVATGNGCFIQKDTSREVILNRERCTAAAKGKNNEHWVASVDTLYTIIHDKAVPDTAYDIKKEGRIIDMEFSEENILWIASYNNGIKAIQGNKKYAFNVENGLLSDQCRSLFIESPGNIWVVTAKGINKIIYKPGDLNKFTVRSITTADGLPSDLIRQVIKRNDTVWVATNKGLVYFNEDQLAGSAAIPVYITKWEVNDSLPHSGELQHDENKISIEFTAISFSSGENTRFKYMLEGTDKNWSYTYQRRIEYASLIPGSYTFIVKAIDKNGIESMQPAKLEFTIAPAFWDTWSFRLLAGALLCSIIILLYGYYLYRKKRMETERSNIDKKFAELKLEAIRSQMDPHFIFNCLNAIQHFNIRNEAAPAQYYMAEFAKLIRKTLNHSRNDFVILEEEIELLETYIKLEQLRFEDQVDHTISIEEQVRKQMSSLKVPSLIFQPFVENAINHGLKYLKDTKGKLTLQFSIVENRLLMRLEDNGIGIIASEKLKKKENSKHESVGMILNNSRIAVINRIHDLDIKIDITDKSVLSSTSQGTIVVISLPILLNS